MDYPFERCWWIDDGKMLAGRYPGVLNVQVQQTMLAALLDSGISCFVNLQQPTEIAEGQPFRDYMPLVEPLAAARNVLIGFRRFPVTDQRVPTVPVMVEILDHIDEQLAAGRRPYIHCWGGNGRTGTVVGCWLVRHGRSADQAVREMEVGRHGCGFRYPAPESPEQRDFVKNWAAMDPKLNARHPAPSTHRSIAPPARSGRSSKSLNWFEALTGFAETSPDDVRQKIEVHGNTMTSKVNGKTMVCGTLETPSLADLRVQVAERNSEGGVIDLKEIVANVRDLHIDPVNVGSLFQVASQFNLLEMVGPDVTPEEGVSRYANDNTQGPACAIAAGAGTIYRNYFAAVNGSIGQSRDNQIDCLADIGRALGNDGSRLWKMRNGYALPTIQGLTEIDNKLASLSELELDDLRGRLRVGVQWSTQVTLEGCTHRVSQAYCSALPVAYSHLPSDLWHRFAKLVLEAAYEATLCLAVLNARRTGDKRVFLTLLGGGAFGNNTSWILDAIERAVQRHNGHSLGVSIVSYGRSSPEVAKLVKRMALGTS